MRSEHQPEPAAEEHATLALYLAGALPEAERAAFERHLAGCERCLDESLELGGTTSALGQFSDDDIAAILAPSLPPAPAPALPPAPASSPVSAGVRPPRPRGASRPAGRGDSARPRDRRAVRRYLAYTGSAVAILLVVGFGALLLNDSGTQPAGAGVTASAEAISGDVSLTVAITGNAHGSTVDAHVTGLRPGVRYRLYAATTDGMTHVVRDWSGDSSSQDVSGEVAVPVDSLSFFTVGPVGGAPFVTAEIERPAPPTR